MSKGAFGFGISKIVPLHYCISCKFFIRTNLPSSYTIYIYGGHSHLSTKLKKKKKTKIKFVSLSPSPSPSIVTLETVPLLVPGMTKVHPNIGSAAATPTEEKLKTSTHLEADAVILTVWKKSLLFNCNGFTVFDGKGNLVFRVDNYMTGSGSNGEIVLMDAAGKPLLTIRRKKLTLADNWLVYDGETAVNPRFSVRKHVNILNSKCVAHVSSTTASNSKNNHMYEIEGSFAHRNCAVYDEKKRRVAEIQRKEAVGGVAFGVDVFRLIVEPKMDTSVAMSIVILLDQMFGSSRRF